MYNTFTLGIGLDVGSIMIDTLNLTHPNQILNHT